jgi:uncharacterized membrane protein
MVQTETLPALVVTAAWVSLYGLSTTVHGPQGLLPDHPELRVVLAGVTVLGSWSLIHTVFAIHYTHRYYGPSNGGLLFPGGDPSYYDFLCYSFAVGVTCQVSDVQVTEPGMRRLTLTHGVLSFFLIRSSWRSPLALAPGCFSLVVRAGRLAPRRRAHCRCRLSKFHRSISWRADMS